MDPGPGLTVLLKSLVLSLLVEGGIYVYVHLSVSALAGDIRIFKLVSYDKKRWKKYL